MSSLPDRQDEPSGPIAREYGTAVARDGTRIYFERCGSGPAIVLIHGLGGNHAVWFRQVPYFARTHTVVTLSQRGFAPSGGDLASYDVDVVVEDLDAVMTAARVEKAVVVGQSMGGWTALGLAMRSPERVTALVLADTLGGISDDDITAQMQAIGAGIAAERGKEDAVGAHPALSGGFSAQHRDLAYLYQTLTTFGSPPPAWMARQLGRARVAGPSLADFRIPTLFVVGTEDRLFPRALIRKGADYIAGSEFAEISGAGHSPYFEEPDAWNEAVHRFVARHAA